MEGDWTQLAGACFDDAVSRKLVLYSAAKLKGIKRGETLNNEVLSVTPIYPRFISEFFSVFPCGGLGTQTKQALCYSAQFFNI